MIAYLDSSAVVKLFIAEPERDQVHAIWSVAEGAVTSRLTYVEIRAGVAAARRSGRLDRAGHAVALSMLDDTWAEMIILDLSADLARRAGDLTETLGLRAGDAVQLASALEIEPDDVMLVSWDARLRGAASNAGLPVFPPEP